MADNLQSGMAQPILLGGYQIVLEALDPDTGAAVSGVTVSDVVITGKRELAGDDLFIEILPARLIPGPGA